MFKKVSIIIVNFNQPEVTYQCLDSLKKLTYPNVEIFVIDNASLPEKRIKNINYPEITLIQSDTNLGFAGGNNLALKIASGDLLLLLNNDTEVTPSFLEPLVETLNSIQDAGIVSPKIIFYQSDNLIQYAGTTAINPMTCRGSTIGYKEKDLGQYDKIYQTDLAHGACMLFKREVMDKIGMLNEDYFLYYEEYDFFEKAKRAGFTIYYNGLSKIFHKQSTSVGIFSPLKAYYMAKNRILFARRNFKGANKVLSISYCILLALPKNIIKETIAGRYKNSLAIIKGTIQNFRK